MLDFKKTHYPQVASPGGMYAELLTWALNHFSSSSFGEGSGGWLMASRKPVAVYSNGNVDIAHLNIPAILVISLLSFVAWFTWSASNERAALEARISNIENVLKEHEKQFARTDQVF